MFFDLLCAPLAAFLPQETPGGAVGRFVVYDEDLSILVGVVGGSELAVVGRCCYCL